MLPEALYAFQDNRPIEFQVSKYWNYFILKDIWKTIGINAKFWLKLMPHSYWKIVFQCVSLLKMSNE